MKLFNNLSDIEEAIGFGVKLPYWYNDEKYLFLDVVDETISFLGFSDSIDAAKKNLSWFGGFEDLLVLKPQKERVSVDTNMEKYIASYKHLIGCDFKHINQKGKYIKKADLGLWNIDKGFVSVQDNANYIYQLRSINLYLDDETLGTYKEYMQLHYPEYENIWSKQL